MTDMIESLWAALKEGKYDDFLKKYNHFYNLSIKQKEDQFHYESMYRSIEDAQVAYGRILKNLIPICNKNKKITNRICYFLPSIDTDLAHIELLYSILLAANKHNFEIFVAGFSQIPGKYKSQLLNDLATKNLIKVIPITHSHRGVVDFINWAYTQQISQIIVTSIPTLVPAFVEIFGSKRVTWLSMKFELSCFPTLTNRISFCGSNVFSDTCTSITWHRNPPSILDGSRNWTPRRRIQPGFKLVTINREEKIRNLVFLNSIVNILKYNQQTQFFWTGRTEDPQILNFFRHNGVDRQTIFIGWVDPNNSLDEFDIFLDTPNLSGSVAAKAFAAGLPIVTYQKSQSWIDFYSEEIQEILLGLGEVRGINALLFENSVQYESHVKKLISNPNFFAYISQLQKYIGKKLFFDVSRTQSTHFSYVKHFVERLNESENSL